jgi:hypothetical protein
VSAYDNDPRVQPDPVVGHGYWLVRSTWQLFNVNAGDDGVFRAFLLDEPQPTDVRRLGRLVDEIPAGDFDSVVFALIGEPQ